ncbi:hypothetical protein PEPS_09390 [Persicobacter psychrovividus]|uniref:Uncharacterized protein n=1 Tax=Persicobacter psychrovividus TaxID=387638 RepID=A0ABN6L738_9BACT|nr:hypothetical protein PEPS_09390 [Persicobacter psychrovividus]
MHNYKRDGLMITISAIPLFINTQSILPTRGAASLQKLNLNIDHESASRDSLSAGLLKIGHHPNRKIISTAVVRLPCSKNST